jgi:hypothetical protein
VPIINLCGCTNNNSTQNSTIYFDTVAITKAKIDVDESLKFSINYHFTYDTTKTTMPNLYNGWVDSFTIDKQKFQLKYDTTSSNFKNFCVEQLKKGRWLKLFNLFLSGDEYGKRDVNNDGYLDFVKFYHSREYIYFYDPLKKTLSSRVCVMPENFVVIDSNKFIFYNFYEAMYGNAFERSQLYTYKQSQPYLYYELVLINNEPNKIEKINFYMFRNGSFLDTLFTKTIETGTNLQFDYEGFWKANYKKLLVD